MVTMTISTGLPWYRPLTNDDLESQSVAGSTPSTPPTLVD
jgi:hypothetical protein